MLYKKFLILFIVFLSTAYFTACSCGCEKTEENTVKGYITVVGNEPDTKLAIKTAADKIYLLQCSKELKAELLKQQGTFYYVKYGDSREQNGATILIVEKVIPLKDENKSEK